MNASIFPSNEVCMYGKELRRLRMAAGLSQEALAQKMGWQHKHSIQRLEKKHHFCLHEEIMNKLLEVLSDQGSSLPRSST